MNTFGVVYVARNQTNGKCYVGQTTQVPEQRFSQHRSRLETSHCRALNAAIKKYGIEKFTFSVLSEEISKEALDQAEISAIAAYESIAPGGYNLKSGGSFGKHSAKTRARMSESRKGFRPSPEVCEGQRQRMLGRSPSIETREKIAATLRSQNRKMSPENQAALIAANTGRVASPESRLKMSRNRSGIPVSEEKKAKLRAANLGKKQSAETRQRMSAAQLKRWAESRGP